MIHNIFQWVLIINLNNISYINDKSIYKLDIKQVFDIKTIDNKLSKILKIMQKYLLVMTK